MDPSHAPRGPGPDLVFLGRSNVGKSSLINRLLGRADLARVSKRPGRTRSVNFYRVNERFHVVDLPGYGYARVPESVRRSWKGLVEGVLDSRRDRIALAVLLVDGRHGPTELDRAMRDWLESKRIPYVVAVHKADQVSAGARREREQRVREALPEGRASRGLVWVSSRTGEGFRALWGHLDRALAADRAAGP